MKKLTILLLILLQTFLTRAQPDSTVAQSDSADKSYHIAIFTPLYLDSVFDQSYSYRFGKTFPKFINPGLEFYEGVQLAIDSLRLEGALLEVHVYDTKDVNKKLDSVLTEEDMSKMNLILGHVTVNEAAIISRAAATLDIPFINVNLPNDAGVTNNPNYVILNSTLLTHCEGMYRFLQKNFALSSITMFRKKGQQEDRLQNYFTEIGRSTASIPLKIKYVTLENNFSAEQVKKYLNEDETNVCIAGSLDVNFAQQLCKHLSSLSETYACTVIGMPTVDAIDLEKPEYKGIEVYYGTPFYINPTDKFVTDLTQRFKTKFYSRPTDMVFRGYETFYHFVHLLMLHDNNLGSSLSDKKFMVFNEFDIQPVLDKKTMTLNYFENRKLYFIRKEDGVIKGVY